MAIKDFWKDYFAFNKRQRNGILVLLFLILLLIIFLFLSDYLPSSNAKIDFSEFKSELNKAEAKPSTQHSANALIDINSADTAELLALPKMTSYCAGMIVRYRKKLGGYYSTTQLKEVWGMDTAIFNAEIAKVRADTGLVTKLDINTASIKQLGYHPYIRYYLAKAIVNYREEHGPFKAVSDLHKMAAVNDSTFSKIEPYLKVGR